MRGLYEVCGKCKLCRKKCMNFNIFHMKKTCLKRQQTFLKYPGVLTCLCTDGCAVIWWWTLGGFPSWLLWNAAVNAGEQAPSVSVPAVSSLEHVPRSGAVGSWAFWGTTTLFPAKSTPLHILMVCFLNKTYYFSIFSVIVILLGVK